MLRVRLYHKTPCPACDAAHTLYDPHPGGHPATDTYGFVCPHTLKVVLRQLPDGGETTEDLPYDAVPMSWVPR